ncbi:MAG TPA: DUF4129 domain-containing protein [Elainellaceae cyanobacterium]
MNSSPFIIGQNLYKVMMSAGSYETTTLGWRLTKLGQRAWEWIELQWSRGGDTSTSPPSAAAIPDWLISAAFWVVLVALLAWLGWQFYQILRPYWSRRRSRSRHSVTRQASRPNHPLSAVDWWRRSHQFQQQGDYREACRALYMAMLHHLSDHHLVTTGDSMTDGDYLRLVQHLPNPHLYQFLISTHELLYFGEEAVSPERWERCRQAYQEIVSP